MDQDSTHMVAASKEPILKPGEYELWRMRMEQYIKMIDYSLWEVIENGNAPLITKVFEGVETIIAPTTAEEKAQKRLELKARITLLIGIPNEHQLKFNSIKDAKSLLFRSCVEARLLVYKKNESVYEEDIKVLKCEIHLREVAITELRRKLELAQKQKDEIKLTVENFKNSSKNLSKLIDCQIVDKYKTEFYKWPYVIKPIVEKSKAKASEAKPKAVRKNNSAPIF
ncbi:hypothetical protein Tco_0723653 [Tanacetum coccineum]